MSEINVRTYRHRPTQSHVAHSRQDCVVRRCATVLHVFAIGLTAAPKPIAAQTTKMQCNNHAPPHTRKYVDNENI